MDLVEASRSLPPEKRQEFMGLRAAQLMGQVIIQHPGVRSGYRAHEQDLDLLDDAGLIARRGQGTPFFYVTPSGFRVYRQLKQEAGAPTERVEAEMRKHIDGNDLRQRYPTAYEKWRLAEELLWSDDSAQQLSAVGHHCREAAQEFATALVARYQPAEAPANVANTVGRIRAVLDAQRTSLPTTVHPFLDALLKYWGTVNDLIQRQVKAAQRESEALTWEDARRVVFQTLVLMYELDRALKD